jgi:XTP/dITP diphosphohydrolase
MTEICFATNNQHKLLEVKAAIPNNIRILSLADIKCHEELPETRDTLEGNSLQKAEYVLANYGVPCFADDTGLEVESLDGKPGVYSARYAGPQRNSSDNINLLLRELVSTANRRARFRTIFTMVEATTPPVRFEGIVTGSITMTPRGNDGFGYDPVFQPDGFNVTFAEMSMQQKNSLSHRARALQKLLVHLRQKSH